MLHLSTNILYLPTGNDVQSNRIEVFGV
jgi:hypothetical protein